MAFRVFAERHEAECHYRIPDFGCGHKAAPGFVDKDLFINQEKKYGFDQCENRTLQPKEQGQ